MIMPYYGCVLNSARPYGARPRHVHRYVSGHTARDAWRDGYQIYRSLLHTGFAPLPSIMLYAEHTDWSRTVTL